MQKNVNMKNVKERVKCKYIYEKISSNIETLTKKQIDKTKKKYIKLVNIQKYIQKYIKLCMYIYIYIYIQTQRYANIQKCTQKKNYVKIKRIYKEYKKSVYRVYKKHKV